MKSNPEGHLSMMNSEEANEILSSVKEKLNIKISMKEICKTEETTQEIKMEDEMEVKEHKVNPDIFTPFYETQARNVKKETPDKEFENITFNWITSGEIRQEELKLEEEKHIPTEPYQNENDTSGSETEEDSEYKESENETDGNSEDETISEEELIDIKSQSVTNEKSIDSNRNTCDVKQLKRHMSTQKKFSKKGNTKRNSKRKRIYSCTVCQREFTVSSNLHRHMRTHTGEKPFSCKECPMRFASKNNLLTHTLIHTNEKPHSCHICQKTFRHKNVLKNHIQLHENPQHKLRSYDEKVFTCNLCQRDFNQRCNLQRHMLLHTGEKPFSCKLCSMRFTVKFGLQSHMLTHKNDKPYTCEICHKKLRRKSSLRDHMRLHSGETTYNCDKCTVCFTTKGSFQTHMQRHANGTLHFCEICQTKFWRRTTLRDHMLMVHSLPDFGPKETTQHDFSESSAESVESARHFSKDSATEYKTTWPTSESNKHKKCIKHQTEKSVSEHLGVESEESTKHQSCASKESAEKLIVGIPWPNDSTEYLTKECEELTKPWIGRSKESPQTTVLNEQPINLISELEESSRYKESVGISAEPMEFTKHFSKDSTTEYQTTWQTSESNRHKEFMKHLTGKSVSEVPSEHMDVESEEPTKYQSCASKESAKKLIVGISWPGDATECFTKECEELTKPWIGRSKNSPQNTLLNEQPRHLISELEGSTNKSWVSKESVGISGLEDCSEYFTSVTNDSVEHCRKESKLLTKHLISSNDDSCTYKSWISKESAGISAESMKFANFSEVSTTKYQTTWPTSESNRHKEFIKHQIEKSVSKTPSEHLDVESTKYQSCASKESAEKLIVGISWPSDSTKYSTKECEEITKPWIGRFKESLQNIVLNEQPKHLIAELEGSTNKSWVSKESVGVSGLENSSEYLTSVTKDSVEHCTKESKELTKHWTTDSNELTDYLTIESKDFTEEILEASDVCVELKKSNKNAHISNICNDQFDKKTLVEEHVMKNCHRDAPKKCEPISRKSESKRMGDKKLLECDACKKTFKWPSDLRRHMLQHTGEKPYSCHLCNKRFTNKRNWLKHLEVAHSVKKKADDGGELIIGMPLNEALEEANKTAARTVDKLKNGVKQRVIKPKTNMPNNPIQTTYLYVPLQL